MSNYQSAGNCTYTAAFGCPGGNTPVDRLWELELRGGGNFGKGLEEKCYYGTQGCYGTGITFQQKFGLPQTESDLEAEGVLYDVCFKIVTRCVVDGPDCADTSGVCDSPPPITLGDTEYCSYNTCDGAWTGNGKVIVSNGCSLQTLIDALTSLSASSGKFQVVDLGKADGYWVGGPRSPELGIPGDSLVFIDLVTTYETDGDNTVQVCEYSYAFSSPSYNMAFTFIGKPLSKCCGVHPAIRFVQSTCGRYDPSTIPGYEVPCGGSAPDCTAEHPPVVPTYRTLAQWESGASVTFVPDFANPFLYLTYCSIPDCPNSYDDFDGAQTCTASF